MNYGFYFNESFLNKQCLAELIKLNKNHIKIFYKLEKKHLDVSGIMGQKISLVVQILIIRLT